MDKMSLWIKMCAVCAIVSAVFTVIVPESKLKGAYKTLCSLIMLFAFFSAFSSGKSIDIKQSDFLTDNSASISEKTDELLIDEGEKMMNNLIENKLYEGGIEAECKTEMHFSDDTMEIQRIYLYGSFSEKETDKAKRIIYDYLEKECEVIFAKKNE